MQTYIVDKVGQGYMAVLHAFHELGDVMKFTCLRNGCAPLNWYASSYVCTQLNRMGTFFGGRDKIVGALNSLKLMSNNNKWQQPKDSCLLRLVTSYS